MASQGVTNVANAIINKINNLISSHNNNENAHQDIRESIPSATSELNNNSGFITSSSIPSASSATPSADTTNGSVGTGTAWARSDHTHPKSSLYAEASHTHSATEIQDSSAHGRIGSGANDNQANINDSIDYALAELDDNILNAKMDLVGFQTFQVKDFINPNNWENSGCTYSDGVLTFSESNSFTATFPTDSLVSELADFELSFDYIIDDGLVLNDTISFEIFGFEIGYTVTEEDIDNGYVIIDVSFKSENNQGIITSEMSGDENPIDYVNKRNPYTINAITPVGDYTKIANIRYKANNIISLNDNKEDVYNKVTSLSSSSTDTQYPSAKAVYDAIEDTFNLDTLDCINENFTILSLPQITFTHDGNPFDGSTVHILEGYDKGAYVDWGDGTPIETYESTDTLKHSYSDSVREHIITIYGDILNLYNNSFKNFIRMTSINIPSGVTSLGQSCFYNCTGLTSVTIPSSVTSLGDNCFRYCVALTNVTIPSSVISLGNYCFSSCSSLTSVTIPNGVTSLGDNCFRYCSVLTNVTIPSSVTSLGDNCFYNCSSLTNVTIPSSVISLGGNCFSGCTNLMDYQLYWETPPVTWSSSLMPNNADTYFTIPNGTTANYTAKSFPSEKLVERSE